MGLRLPCRSRRGGGTRGLIGAGYGAGGDGQTIPHIDGGSENGKVHDFFFAEMRFHFFIDVIGDVSFGNQGHSFDPGEGGAFSFGVKGRLAPGIQGIQALLGLAEGAGIFRMHVNAIGAAVDLRGAQLQQVELFVIEATGGEIFFEAEHGFLRIKSKS